MEVEGKPILVYTAAPFQDCPEIDHILVVAAEEWKEKILGWKVRFGLTKLRAVAPGGADRQESILNGLLAARDLSQSETDGAVIQDAARPLTSGKLIKRLLEGLSAAPCVLPAIPPADTVYASPDGQWVEGVLERSSLYAGQAPEAFNYRKYLELYQSTPPEIRSSLSGSCQLPFRAGWKVKIIPGEADNIKITYPMDLKLFQLILRERKAQHESLCTPRCGRPAL